MSDEKDVCLREIYSAVEQLSTAQKIKLKKFADYRILSLGKNANFDNGDDLLNEAICRALSGIRKWNPSKVTFFNLLQGIIKSISSKDHRGSKDRDPTSNILPVMICFDDDKHADPSHQVEKEFSDKELVQQVRDLFPNDQLMQDIIDGIMQEMAASDVQKIIDISAKEYDACRKRFFRTTRKHLMME